MAIEFRELGPEYWDLFYSRLERAFSSPPDSVEERAQWRRVAEFDRITAGWDEGSLVATSGAFSFRMTVPGGSPLPVAGVTMVSVQSTHRRRGVLTAMMRRQLDDIRRRGESVAVLTASEPAIYGRFGYGVASRQLRGAVDTTRVRFAAPEGVDELRMRLVDAAGAVEACEAVYAGLVPRRPGMLARQPGWETQPLLPPTTPAASGGLLCVLAESGGELRGYARYWITPHWSAAGPESVVQVRDVEALDPVAYAALWRYLASIDLTAEVAFGNRPVDDPLLHLVSDVRRCGLNPRDGFHLRLVDVGAALQARSYTTPLDVVLDIDDPFCPWNTGRWRLSADGGSSGGADGSGTDGGGAVCERTTDPADLALGVRELGAAYLGDTSLHSLAGAALVRELRPGALAATARAFHSDQAPWLPHGF
ncbi:GNAT family N-acetyltransferase [Actinacidiphila yeochonensis]|uniref:GNAT family N-acetyltransferase n=1 Tax=Actinacidiphila yeochonensis TaxID=89050 RepID=UPI00055BC01D|nr:GNAT family N-acetyltransferase [Actinacidiphila yeochonensis]